MNPHARAKLARHLGLVFVLMILSWCAVGCPVLRHVGDVLMSTSTRYYPAFWWKDSTYFVWCYAWWPHAIANGLNPFVSQYAWFPHEANMVQQASIPTLALLMAPVTAIWGPVASYNLMQLFTPALCSYFTFLWVREWSGRTFVSGLAGLVFGFSPYVMGHLPIHANLGVVWLLPLGTYVYLLWWKRRMSSAVFVPLVSVIAVAQAGVSLEIAALAVVAIALAMLVYADRLSMRVVKTGVAVTLCSLLLGSPLIYYFVIGGFHNPSVPVYSAQGADLLDAVVPLPQILLRFTGIDYTAVNVPESTIYVGVFAIALVAACWAAVDKRLLVLVLLYGAISVGSPISLGLRDTGIWNPFGHVHNLPLFKHAVMGRFSVFMWLAIALLSLDLLRFRTRAARVLAALTALSLLPNPGFAQWYKLDENFDPDRYSPIVPPLFRTGDDRARLTGKAFIVVPVSGLGNLWQTSADMRFKMLGVYDGLYYPPPPFPAADGALLGPLFNRGHGTADPDWAGSLAVFCRDNKIDGIILDPNPWAPTGIVAPLLKAGWREESFGRTMVLYRPS